MMMTVDYDDDDDGGGGDNDDDDGGVVVIVIVVVVDDDKVDDDDNEVDDGDGDVDGGDDDDDNDSRRWMTAMDAAVIGDGSKRHTVTPPPRMYAASALALTSRRTRRCEIRTSTAAPRYFEICV